MYDTIIIGAGISGLYTALKLIDDGYRVLLLEKSDRVGGRVHTLYTPDYILELGAFRISSEHKIILDLCRRFQIPVVPFAGASSFRPSYHNYEDTASPFKLLIQEISKAQLSYQDQIDLTIPRLLERNYNLETALVYRDSSGYSDYYSSSIYQILMTDTIKNLLHEGTFYKVPTGLSSIINQILKYLCQSPNFTLLHEGVVWTEYEHTWRVWTSNHEYQARTVVFAVPKRNLLDLYKWSPNDLLIFDGVKTDPITKIIMKFPKVKGSVWFEKIPVVITDALIMKFLPANYEAGIAIISYCDGIRAKYLHNLWQKDPQLLITIIMEDLRTVFPTKTIPDPVEVQHYYWNPGVHYWRPGIDIVASQAYIRNLSTITPLFIVGEAYSTQAWMNPTLMMVDAIYEQLLIQLKNNYHT